MPRRANPASVLVIDDDPGILIFIGRLLERQNMRALFARNLSEAMGIAARDYVSIDLILVNLTLPELSGPEAVNRLRELRPGLPSLYMSARTEGGIIRIDVMQRDSSEPDNARGRTFFEAISEALAAPKAISAGHRYPYQ